MSINEFSLIDNFFKKGALARDDVIFGIGDDAACVALPPGQQLLISTDTLVSGVHFLPEWDPFDIAWKAVMVNVSDMAAMTARPCWLSLALTLPQLNEVWLERFAQGLHAALRKYQISLIGGDTTKGPLSLTLTIHGTVPCGKALRRAGAQPGDSIWVSGELGAAALAVSFLNNTAISVLDQSVLMDKLLHPIPRIDLLPLLQEYGSAAIDISDGLSADLHHICEESGVGAYLSYSEIPIHPLVRKHREENAVAFAISGGDDYELCFTIPARLDAEFRRQLQNCGLVCYSVGVIEEKKGLRFLQETGKVSELKPKGYTHF